MYLLHSGPIVDNMKVWVQTSRCSQQRYHKIARWLHTAEVPTSISLKEANNWRELSCWGPHLELLQDTLFLSPPFSLLTLYGGTLL